MKTIVLNIEGMTCSGCSTGLEKYLNKQDGIKNASVNLVMAQAMIEYDENKLSKKDLDKFVKQAGFKSLGEDNLHNGRKGKIKIIVGFTILMIVLMYFSMGNMLNMPIPELKVCSIVQMIITIVFLIWGIDIFINGLKNILHRSPNMDSLVGLGVIINFGYSVYNTVMIYRGDLSRNLYFESSAMIVLFVKFGRYIEGINKYKAVQSIKNLVKVTPKTGVVIRDNEKIEVNISDIEKGDIVVCKPGEKIAVDGIVVKGKTHTDESFITGESKPVNKEIGSKVFAGSINYDGYIEYEAESIGKNSWISQVVNLVVKATNSKAPIEKMADIISSYFVISIFLIALIVFFINYNLGRSIEACITSLVTVLVISCPCSFGLATPLAKVIAIGNASKKGIIIKSSEVFETINKIDTVICDKTGTITKGEMEIVDSKFVGNKDEYFNLLQSLESHSNHPLAKAICKVKSDVFDLEDVERFDEIRGKGIKGEIKGHIYFAGNRKLFEEKNVKFIFEDEEKEYLSKGETIIYFGNNFELFGIVGLKDEIKEYSKELILKLKEDNKKVIMLSGDNEEASKMVGSQVGINKIYWEASPKEKLDKINELNKNNNILMIGDGINDSPALRSSAIGVSVSNGTDISSDASDVVLLSDDMDKLSYLFELGKKTVKIIKENLFWALIYNILMIPLATGLFPITVTPMLASMAMTFSSMTVVLNSLRLLKK